MTPLKIEELNKLHQDSKALDRESLAEMRSNILLIGGEHYSKRNVNDTFNRSRTQGSSPDNYKLRITKNWIHRAHRLYVSSITSQSPGVTVSPRTATELQDQKSAELNLSVWQYAKDKYKFKALIRDFASSFCGIGECVLKIIFDPSKGPLKGYAPMMDEMNQPVVDPQTGQPMPDETKPVFKGEFVFQEIYGQNLFRDPSCRKMKDARWLGIENLESIKGLKEKYAQDKEKLKYIEESVEDFVVFDTSKVGYGKDKDQCLLKEYYFKPCQEYPEGYYYITTKSGILEEGPLPGGLFPIVWKGFDEHPTKPRATSIVKVARPWQAEINRASSQQAMHQVTISEDKILYQAGTKVSQGSLLPGVRGMTYQGAPPTILPGRAGEQYVNYISTQKTEMDEALMINMLDEEKIANLDPIALLFRTMNQTKKFSFYSDKFGEFLVEWAELFLQLAKIYLDDDEIIAAVGRAEAINIPEFKSTSPFNHLVKVEEQTDAIESKLGKQLVLNHVLQYVGTQLQRDDIGKLIVEMPFGNWEESFSDFTMDYKNVKNDFLAIERGQTPKISPQDKSGYCLKQVSKRIKERDFDMLDPKVRQLYSQYQQFHIQKQAQEAQALKQMESEFIPTGGAMIAADMYVPDKDPSKQPKRVRLPYQAVDWLVNMLEKQGMGQEAMSEMSSAQTAEVAKMLLGGRNAPSPSSVPQNGQVSPGVAA